MEVGLHNYSRLCMCECVCAVCRYKRELDTKKEEEIKEGLFMCVKDRGRLMKATRVFAQTYVTDMGLLCD